MKKRIVSILLVLVLMMSMFFSAIPTAYAADANSGYTVVTFTSDVHHISTKDNASALRLKNWLLNVADTYGEIDALGICGDLAIWNVNGSTFWSYAQRVIDNVDSLGIDGIYTTGNHEHSNGNFSNTDNATTRRYTRLGLGKAASNYEIYCMGAASGDMTFPQSDIDALAAYLRTVGTAKPVFILSHYPLHVLTFVENGKTKIRDAGNRQQVIALLNQYPNTFFIWGHNHSHDDPNYDMIQTEAIGDTPINFTYAAGGSMTDSSENAYGGDVVGKGLVALISPDGSTVSLRYLDEQYNAFAEWENRESVRYTVSFDANGGSGTMASQLADADDDGLSLYTAPATCNFTAPAGKHFAGWALTSTGEAEDDFVLTGNTTLYAVWEDGINLASVTMLACANPQAGLDFEVPVTFTANGSGYTGTLQLPGNVDTDQIRLSWAAGTADTVTDGVHTYGRGEAPIASDGGSVTYTVTAFDGAAPFTVQTVCAASCIRDVPTSLQAGQLRLLLSGTEVGTFTFAQSSGKWTICDANGKYLALSNNALSRSSSSYKWSFSNNKFSASSSWRTYYLAVSNGSLTVSTSDRNNVASFIMHQERQNHVYSTVVTPPTCTEGGYTTYTCECGMSYIGSRTEPAEHSFELVVTAPTCTEGGFTTYTCTVCGESHVDDLTDPIPHAYNAVVTAPTCTAGGFTTYTCDVCGDSYVADLTDPAPHTYTAVVTDPTCTAGGYITYTCTECGDTYVADETDPIPHTYTADVTAPTCTAGGYTTYTCECGDSYITDWTDPAPHTYTAVVTAPTCTTGGYTTYTCVCGESYIADETDPIPHTYTAVVTEPTCTEGGYTTYTCVCGDSYVADETDPIPHAYTTAVTAPTCTENGFTTYTCVVCGDSYTANETEALGHNYTANVTAPTCIAGGFTVYTCTECGDSYMDDRTDRVPHTYTAVVTAPTCTEGGYTTYTCDVCGDSYTDDLTDTVPHTYTAVITAPTCAAGGYTTYTCVCGESYIADETDPIPHTYTAVVTAPTCTESGYVTYTCSVCGDSYVADPTDPIPHTYTAVVTAPTCTAGGYTTYTCECGDSYVADETAPIPHTYTAVVTAPTCTEEGYTTYTCAVCGNSYTADEIEALGHNYTANITAPTCIAGGFTVYTCTECGDSYMDDLTDIVPHTYTAVVTAPTCTEGGYTTYTCSVCGDSYISDETEALGHDYQDGTCTRCGAEEFIGTVQYQKVDAPEQDGTYLLTIRDEAEIPGGTLFTFTQNGTTDGSYTIQGSNGYLHATRSTLSFNSAVSAQSSWKMTMGTNGAVTLRNYTNSRYYLLYSGGEFVVNKTNANPLALYDANGVKLTALPQGTFTAYICNADNTKSLSDALTAEDTETVFSGDYVIADAGALEEITLHGQCIRDAGNVSEWVYRNGTLSCGSTSLTYANGMLTNAAIGNGALVTGTGAVTVQLWEKTVIAPQTDAYLAITCDIHNKFREDFAVDSETGDVIGTLESSERLSNWLDQASEDFGGIYFDQFITCGDSGDGNRALAGASYWDRVLEAMDVVANHEKILGGGFFINGNHEWQTGYYDTYKTTNAAAMRIREAGYVEQTDNYILYSLSAAQTNNSFNTADISALEAFLATAPADRPIFIFSHYPLHNYNRTEQRKDDVIRVLNEYGDSLQIIFFWGHNHTEEDPHYGTIYTEEIDGTPINFTYCSAGCMSDEEYDVHAVNTRNKGTVAYIAPDKSVTLTYYDVNYQIMSSTTLTKPGTQPIHALVRKEAVPATCTETGISGAYWLCTVCGKYFSDSEGLNEITAESLVAPTVPHSYVDGYCTVCGARDPDYGPVCEGEQAASLQEGELRMIISGKDFGMFTFDHTSSGWTIQDANGKYLAISNKALTRSSSPFNWTFSNNTFSAAVSNNRWSTTTYYLYNNNNSLGVSTRNSNNKVSFRIYGAFDEHSFGAWTADNGTHSRVCTVCGAVESFSCEYGEDHLCSVCGDFDPAHISVSANVNVTSSTSSYYWYTRTTYTATITTSAIGTQVTNVQYSTNNSSWTSGTSYSSSSQIRTLYIRVTDARGTVHSFVYRNGETTAQ